MKTNQVFTSNNDPILTASLADLDRERKETAKKVLLRLVPFSLLAFGVMFFITYQWIVLIVEESRTASDKDEMFFAGLVGCIFIVAPFIWGFFARRKRIYRNQVYDGAYFNKYKKMVIPQILKQLNVPLRYMHQTGIAEKDFRASGFPLFAHPASFFSYDSFEGEIGKTKFQFGEVLAEQLIGDRESKHYTDLFRGVFFVADLHKGTDWNTIVYPDVLKYFSKLLVGKHSEEEAFRKQKYERIKLEDPEFERYFEVYGTDQVESRYLLSPALMARLVNFKRQTKKDIQISFKNNSVYFAIYYAQKKPIFKPPLFTTVYDSKKVENYVSDLTLMIDLVKELNINSKMV